MNLPDQYFWIHNSLKCYLAEAISVTTYLKNRSPTRVLQGKTPYEAWHNEKPGVDHIHVFGCEVYVHIPKDEQHKLYSKAKKCILLGYGEETKGYRLYDVENKKILYSRDVRFNEGEVQSQQPSEDTGSDYRYAVDFPSDAESEPGQPADPEGTEPQ